MWELVDQSFLPARSDAFDRAAWAALREGVKRKPPKSRNEAYTLIRRHLGTLGDPFTRFVFPNDFEKLKKYDITVRWGC